MLEGGDTALAEENRTYKTNSSEKLAETSCFSVGKTESILVLKEDNSSNVQLVSASVPAKAVEVKPECGADDGPEEAAEEVAREETHGAAAVADSPRTRASAARALLSLVARGALALVAADVLVGRPLQRVSSSAAARFWAVGFIVGMVFFLTAASIGNQWKRRGVSILPLQGLVGGSPQEQQLVHPVPAEDQQTAEAHFPQNSSHRVKQYVCEDIVFQTSSDNCSETHFVRSHNDNAVVL